MNANPFTQPFQTTLPGQKTVPLAHTFADYLQGGYAGNSVIFGLSSVRMRVFSEGRFQFQRLRNGRPGDLFGNTDLALLERPWPGGTTGDLLSAMLLHADFAGNAFVVKRGDRLVMLRPDWVQLVLGDLGYDDGIQSGGIAYETLGFLYYQGGVGRATTPIRFSVEEVAHFMPQPDPRVPYNIGMSWLTPVIREIQADTAATTHKLRFLENSATPNLAVSLPKEITPDQFNAFVERMESKHTGPQNAGRTLYTGGGADVTVIGANMQQLDFKVTQGAGETRLAQAAGVPAVVAGISEGLAGSSLNAGNFGQARRQFADTTMSNLWRNVAGSLEQIIVTPSDARLWIDTRDISFLREDEKDEAEIQATQAGTIKALTEAGFEPDSILAAVQNLDWSLLVGQHTGLYSVQLQTPGSTKMPTVPAPEEVAAGTSQTPGKNLAAPAPMPALPPGREEPIVVHIHNNIDNRIAEGAFQITTHEAETHIDARHETHYEQLVLEARNAITVPELPPAQITVVQEAAKPMRHEVVRDSHNRIVETIDHPIDE